MKKVIDLINESEHTAFSFEILPPLRGNSIQKVYNVIDGRARVDKPMILTTNLSFDEMMRNPDIRYRRIYDRIFETCIPVEISGNSFRIMRAAQRQKRLENYFEAEE